MGVVSLPVVSCDDCGACCMHMGSPAFNGVGPGVKEVLGDQVVLAKGEELEWLRSLPPEGERELTAYMVAVLRREIPSRSGREEPCLWLDPVTRRCRYYEHRPQVCRDFEVGSRGCHSHRRARG